ncbi:hypothetical protein NGB36_15615 [Streptomyces sp. RB6PN25]|uniref:Response regulatory domain-containing protein n=1 Tax=Streptomyces humicola TaxID=2953240 RepID=A0ABT1PY12_9ACTN|nr:hypothetical protein [Streptomyces humicola]MCQ4081998.1 hypothetical protein [Streptomyces humicola]
MARPAPVRVVLADALPLVRAALAMLVESAWDMEVVGQAGSAGEAAGLVRDERADVLVIDTALLADVQVPTGVRVLLLAAHDEYDEYIVPASAFGVLPRNVSPDELLRAIRSAAATTHRGQ